MAKVVVIKTNVPDRVQTEYEKEAYYNDLAARLPNIDKQHFDDFMHMDTVTISANNMASILIKQCEPLCDIIIEPPKKIEGGKANAVKKKPPKAQKMALLSSKAQKMTLSSSKAQKTALEDDKAVVEPQPTKPNNGTRYSIITQFDKNINCYDEKLQIIKSSGRNKTVAVIGLIFRNNTFSYDMRLTKWSVDKIPFDKILYSGLWNKSCRSSGYVLDEVVPNYIKSIIFTDEKHAISEMMKIYNYITWYKHRVESSFLWAFYLARKIVQVPLNIKLKPLIDTKLDSTTEKLNKIIEGQFIVTSDLRHHANLISYNMLELFYLLKNYNSAEVNELYDIFKQKYEHTLAMRDYNNKQRHIILKQKKLQIISFNKWKKHYHALTKNERDDVIKMYEREEKKQFLKDKIPEQVHKLWSNDFDERLKTYKDLQANQKKYDIVLKDIICEHVDYLMNEYAKFKQINVQKLLSKYAAQTEMKDFYYCRICGEELAPYNAEDVLDKNTKISFESYSAIERLIWQQSNEIFTNNMSFKYGINPSIYSIIVDTISPIIDDIYIKLSKVKSNSDKFIDDSVLVYIGIYIYAMCIRLINSSKDIDFKTKLNTTGSRDAKLFTIAINLIMRKYNMEINNINFNVETIKKLIIGAYKIIGKQSAIDESDKSHGLSLYINCDPVYFMVAHMIKKNPNDITAVLDKSTEELIASESLYDKVALLKTDSLDEIPKILSLDSDMVYMKAIPRSLVILSKHIYNILVEYFDKYWHEIASPMSENLIKFNEQLAIINDMEKYIINAKRITKVPPIGHIIKKFDRTFKRTFSNLALLYDNKGKKVKWTTYVVEIGGKTKDLTIKEINAMIGSPEYYKMKIVDMKNNNGATIKKINIREITENLAIVESKRSFYNFYRYRCPLKLIHDMDRGKCSNCNFMPEYVDQLNDAYYNKWKKTFETSKYDDAQKIKFEKPILFKKSKLDKYSVDTMVFRKFASLFSVQYNVIYNLGLTFGYDYLDIKNVNVNPSEKSMNINRVKRLMSYYQYIYQTTRIVNRRDAIRYIPYDLKKITEKIDIKLSKETSALEYKNYSIVDQSLFILENICTELINLHKQSQPLAKYLVEKILYMDSEFANYSVKMLKDSIDIIDYKINSDDTLDEAPEENDDIEGHSKYSYEGMDFEDGWEENVTGTQEF